MQEWNVQSGGRKSTLSEKPFEDGDTVRSLLCIDGEGNLVRHDLAENDEWTPTNARVLGQWIRTFRHDTTEKELQKEAIQSTEDLFFQMVESNEEESSENNPQEKVVLTYLMALFLERKRILRGLGRPDPNGVQSYRHPGRKIEVSVQTTKLDSDILRRLAGQLEQIFI